MNTGSCISRVMMTSRCLPDLCSPRLRSGSEKEGSRCLRGTETGTGGKGGAGGRGGEYERC